MMDRCGAALLSIASAWQLACASALGDEPLGSVENPVRVDGRRGEVAYLGRLRCPSGWPPHFRMRDRGPHGPSGRGLDRFTLRCVTDNLSFEIWLDSYHPDFEEDRPVAGLEIEEP